MLDRAGSIKIRFKLWPSPPNQKKNISPNFRLHKKKVDQTKSRPFPSNGESPQKKYVNLAWRCSFKAPIQRAVMVGFRTGHLSHLWPWPLTLLSTWEAFCIFNGHRSYILKDNKIWMWPSGRSLISCLCTYNGFLHLPHLEEDVSFYASWRNCGHT